MRQRDVRRLTLILLFTPLALWIVLLILLPHIGMGILSLREKEFVEAARALGASTTRQVVRHILPNALGPVIVVATIDVAASIIFESTLSFRKFGSTSR